ncbi:MAG: DsbA family oxidoreductase [Candidatus Promineofilum sp.]|nr:DsbA family oxidoreductase [Promineifilum sp.]
MDNIQIDVFSDTVCPWCRIGKRHLELALADWEGEPVTVRFRSFFLDPTTPAEGRDFKANMLAKGGGRRSLEDFFGAPRERGAAVGLTFDFDAIEKSPNTMLSHRLVYLTPEERRGEVLDAIYTAYFEDGRDIGDIDVLIDVAQSCGLDGMAMREALAGDAAEADVLADLDFARQAGISGVPFFIFNNKYAFSGAQPPDMIRRVLAQVADDKPAAQ